MTTAWAHFTHGHLVEAFKTHVGGTVLAAAAFVSSVAALGIAVVGRWPAWRPSEKLVMGAGLGVVVLVLVEWAVRW